MAHLSAAFVAAVPRDDAFVDARRDGFFFVTRYIPYRIRTSDDLNAHKCRVIRRSFPFRSLERISAPSRRSLLSSREKIFGNKRASRDVTRFAFRVFVRSIEHDAFAAGGRHTRPRASSADEPRAYRSWQRVSSREPPPPQRTRLDARRARPRRPPCVRSARKSPRRSRRSGPGGFPLPRAWAPRRARGSHRPPPSPLATRSAPRPRSPLEARGVRGRCRALRDRAVPWDGSRWR